MLPPGKYGLAATVLTGNIAHVQQAVAALPVGTVKINEVFGGAPGGSAQPRGASGDGFGYGPELLDEFTPGEGGPHCGSGAASEPDAVNPPDEVKPVSQVPAPGAVTGDLSSQRALAGWLPGRLAAEQPAILVIGDVMLDGWWSGTIERLCREAPAPVVDVDTREFAPGGAANTAMNLAALGARVSVAGIIGTDDAGADLRRQLEAGRHRRQAPARPPGHGHHHQDPDQQRRPGDAPHR